MLKTLSRHNIILLLFALTCTSVLLLLQRLTAAPILQQQLAHQQALLQQVLPDIEYDNNLLQACYQLQHPALGSQPQQLYLAYRKNNIVARVISTTATGYAGPIQLLIGITAKGEILKVTISSHQETPGIGDKIDPQRSNWIQQFSGRQRYPHQSERWDIRKMGGDFDQLSGATVTTRAVIQRLQQTLDYLLQQPLNPQQLSRCQETR